MTDQAADEGETIVEMFADIERMTVELKNQRLAREAAQRELEELTPQNRHEPYGSRALFRGSLELEGDSAVVCSESLADLTAHFPNTDNAAFGTRLVDCVRRSTGIA
jgi:hypothetical protein